eukprot:scaffold1169_cov120-Cylindrotheca_fusiformis.AAC.5
MVGNTKIVEETKKKKKKTRRPRQLRLMQWNILADGLGEDGFLTTEFSPIHEIISSETDGSKSFPANEVIKMVRQAKSEDMANGSIHAMKRLRVEKKRLKKLQTLSSEQDSQGIDKLKETIAAIQQEVDESQLVKIKKQFENSPELKRVVSEILNWEMRYNRIRTIVLSADPDVITFQEMDHLKQFLEDEVFSSRYTCMIDAKAKYNVPTYSDPTKEEEDDLRRANYMAHLLKSRAAFAPKSYSHAYNFRKNRNNGAAAMDLDDDGVAVFWKRDQFMPVELGYLQFPPEKERSAAAIAITLQHVTTKERINVLTTHLPSGDDAEKEQERLTVLKNPQVVWTAKRLCLDGDGSWNEVAYELDKPFDGVVSYVRYFVERQKIDDSRTIFALDANSRPSFPLIRSKTIGEPKETNVWRMILEGTGLDSVWVQMLYLDSSSGRAVDPKYPIVASVNKMRGPSSDQPSKIGEHQLELIDHVFTNAATSTLVKEVEINDNLKVPMAPVCYATKEGEAELHLYPTSAMPSDHLPILVDIEL